MLIDCSYSVPVLFFPPVFLIADVLTASSASCGPEGKLHSWNAMCWCIHLIFHFQTQNIYLKNPYEVIKGPHYSLHLHSTPEMQYLGKITQEDCKLF